MTEVAFGTPSVPTTNDSHRADPDPATEPQQQAVATTATQDWTWLDEEEARKELYPG